MKVNISGDNFEVVKLFPATSQGAPPTLNGAEPSDSYAGKDRAIVKYGDALVMARKLSDEEWELAEPARPGIELDTLNQIVKARGEGSTTTVTAPDGTTTTHKD